MIRRRKNQGRPPVDAEQYERVLAERDTALRDLKTERFNVRRVTAEYTRLHDENERLDAEGARLRKEAAAREQLVGFLQKQLDDAVSGGAQHDRDLDTAGAREQARRVKPGVTA